MADASLIGLVAGSSVLAAVVTQGVGWARDWYKSGREASFSALYLALALEAYGKECSETISDSERWEASNESDGSPRYKLSDVPLFPEEIDWKALGIDVTSKALAYPVAVSSANLRIAGEFEYGDMEEGVYEVRNQAVKLGLEAFNLADTIRKTFKIPPAIEDAEWSSRQHLIERRTSYQAQLAAREQAIRDFAEQIAGPNAAGPVER